MDTKRCRKKTGIRENRKPKPQPKRKENKGNPIYTNPRDWMTERFRQGATEFPRSFRVLRPYSGLHQDGIGNPDLLPVKSTIPRTTNPTGWAA